jgi:serine/threonine-protein phosphatase 2B catalytic subunit
VQACATTIPTDDQFFSKTEKDKPDVEFLGNHFHREGRIREEHALYILEKATQLLRAEPNVLTVDSPVTGATTAYTSASSSNIIPFSSLW